MGEEKRIKVNNTKYIASVYENNITKCPESC
jgi:hypothetical protein